MDATALKKVACDAIDKASEELNSLSQEIWNHPELNFEEHFAHQTLTDFFEKHGFPIERKFVVDTGFRAEVGASSGPNVAILCEYDALPGIGHACGHNLIAEAGAGASIGVKAALDAAKDAGKEIGKLTLLGTPAEEGGNGKGVMINAGAFKKVDAAMMVHPYGPSTGGSPNLLDMNFLCLDILTITYRGKASHAAGFPWQGVNALDAAVMAYSSISSMRQQMKPTWRIHGVITNGGTKPNIIPEESALEYYIRAPTSDELEELRRKTYDCINGAAMATGCTVAITTHDIPYLNVVTNWTLARKYLDNAKEVGSDYVERHPPLPGGGTTDMGNVSYVTPAFHPMYVLESEHPNHSRGFTEATGHPDAQKSTIQQAKAMAMTTIDIFCDPELMGKAKEEYDTTFGATK